MGENENMEEGLRKIYPSDKKKKKFVYLDKYEKNKDLVNDQIMSLRTSMRIFYVVIAILGLTLIYVLTQ